MMMYVSQLRVYGYVPVRVAATAVVVVCVNPRNERSEFGLTGPRDLFPPADVKVTTLDTALGAEKLPSVDRATLPGVTIAALRAARVV